MLNRILYTTVRFVKDVPYASMPLICLFLYDAVERDDSQLAIDQSLNPHDVLLITILWSSVPLDSACQEVV